jgi:hypothetical protein
LMILIAFQGFLMCEQYQKGGDWIKK